MAGEKVSIVFDTDLGADVDDLYALYLALFHPRLELVAVTTVHGNTQRKARLAAKALRLAGRADIPVGAGIGLSKARLDRGQVHPDPNQSDSYTAYVVESDPEYERAYPDAVELMSRVLSEATGPVVLIGEGAMSNLAALLQQVTLAQRARIEAIALMGGEVEADRVEHNVLCDPEAADLVLSSGMPVFLGTYLVTSQLRMTMEEVEARFAGSEKPVIRALYDCTQLWAAWRGPKLGPVLYDVVPVFWAVDRSCVRVRRSTIRVELEGGARGRTVRETPAEEGPVWESLGLDPKAMMADLLEILACGAASAAG